MKYGARKRSESACSDADVDYAQAESELAKLHRQYRILECHRKAYLEESRNIMRKQRYYLKLYPSIRFALFEKENYTSCILMNICYSNFADKIMIAKTYNFDKKKIHVDRCITFYRFVLMHRYFGE